jgi:capsular exopolysaccharide synthesis family protein
MSKNFELLQQTELNGGPAPVPGAPRTAPVGLGGSSSSANGHARRDLDQIGDEECLRLVQTVFLSAGAAAPRVVMFAGIDPGNGCSHVCARVAESLATNIAGSVCIVDANLRTPSMPEFFGVTNHHGLTDSLRATGSIRGFAKKLHIDNLWLLSCGSLAADSSTLLNSQLLKSRIAELRNEFDYVLIDSPALNTYSDAIVVGQLSDGMVLVIEANSTRRDAATRIAENLRSRQVRVLGAVLNKRTYPIPEALYHLL